MRNISIQVSNLQLSVAGKTVLQDLEFSVPQNKITGIIGPNSAGKSSLLKTLLGLYAADQGEINILGKDLCTWNKNELAKAVAYLPQDAHVHWPLTVKALVALGRLPHRRYFYSNDEVDDRIINNALDFTDTLRLKNRIATQLSGGELARVLLARAMAVDAAILLADEPVSHLDPYYQLSILGLLQKKAKKNMTIILVLHDLVHAARFCDHLLLLHNGKLVAQGTPCQVVQPDIIQTYYRVNLVQTQIRNKTYALPWTINSENNPDKPAKNDDRNK